ncbi:MAG: D-alanyl-D-alanine carboxypeptidase/D-alanyl-D-alanine-endopeptidase [Actinomycetaceae bacterium]|nr:D-alanyl-D-alanine carboxypeptidase/D-alanyl-D-alanine-endopeptidase [Actinomycetaceae bacterium]
MKRRTQVAFSAVLALVAGYLVADAYDLTPGMLTTRATVPDPLPYPSVNNGVSNPVLPSFDAAAPIPSANDIEEAIAELEADPRVTGVVSVEMSDALTGETIVSHNADQARTPASNMKLVTATVALETLGPDTTLRTTTKLSGTTVYLVGGGDTLLAAAEGDPAAVKGRAGLGDLARDTSAALKERGVTSVTVEVDSSLFSGPLYHPDITGSDTGYIMEMRPIAVMQSRNEAGAYTRDADLSALQIFADALTQQGIEVTVSGRETVPDDADELAEVRSATVRELVDFALTDSDNTTADVLGHMVALERGKEGSFEGAAEATREVLTELGYGLDSVVISDNSGLSPSNKLTTGLLLEIVDNVYRCDGCALESIASGVPVSGLSGTLDDRYGGEDMGARIHAKTGTLTTAASLSGFLLTTDGRLLEFSVLIDQVEEGTVTQARLAIDDFMTSVARL